MRPFSVWSGLRYEVRYSQYRWPDGTAMEEGYNAGLGSSDAYKDGLCGVAIWDAAPAAGSVSGELLYTWTAADCTKRLRFVCERK